MGEKAEPRIIAEDLLPRRGEGHGHEQTRGKRVTATYRVLPIFMMMVVATQRATIANSWLEIPNNGQSELIPPKGSLTPCQRKNPHAATIRALVPRMDGYQLVRPRGFQIWPRASWIMKRPTRVPASRTVRMN